MAPEFGVRDSVDARVDLYAVGVLLFMLLTGLHPGSRSTSRGSTELAVKRQLAGEAIAARRLTEIAPQVPEVVATVVSGLLEPDPNQRIRTAALAFDALFAWFIGSQQEHRVRLSHAHVLQGKPYLAAAGFSGRKSEVAQAEDFLRANLHAAPVAAIPKASALLISGEAGMGKSRLTHRIRRMAQHLGFAVHTMVAQSGQGAFTALEEWQQHFRENHAEALRRSTPEEAAAAADPHHRNYVPDRERDSAYVLLRQSEFRPEERPAYNELLEHYLLDRFGAEVRFASYGNPLCFIIEDAQWLDAGTIKYLFWCMRYLSSSKARGLPVKAVFVLNCRSKDSEGGSVSQVEAQLADLARMEEAPRRIELLGFSEQDACEVVASMLQVPATAPEVEYLVALLKKQRALSPLYVEQSIWTLFASGALLAADSAKRWEGQWQLSAESLAGAGLPSSVREAMGSRASRLSAETLRVLGVAAVAGKHFDVEVVARAAELDAEEVLTALEQAGRAGFVLQEQGSSRRYLWDAKAGDLRYRFSHDRYRESIFSGLEPAAKRTISGQLARAILARWGENANTYPLLAEHYFGAAEYPQSYANAKKVAEQAHGEGNHERATDYFRLALDSQRLAGNQIGAGTALRKLKDQAAESLAAVGRFEEANTLLAGLIEDEEVPRQKRLDCQRRIAESYYAQHDFAKATEQLSKLLTLLGVDLKETGWDRALTLARGAAAFLWRGPFGLGFNRRPAESPSEDMMISQVIYTLGECAAFSDFGLCISASLLLLHRDTTRGLQPFTPVTLLAVGQLFAAQGLFGMSLRYEQRVSELFPELKLLGNQPSPAMGTSSPGPATDHNVLGARALSFALLAMTRFFRGDFLNAGLPNVADILRQGILAADMAADIQKRWIVRSASYMYCLFTGRVSCFQEQLQACLDMFRRTRIFRRDSILTPLQKGILHEVAGRHAQAVGEYQESKDRALEHGSLIEALMAHGSAMLNVALDDPLPPPSLVPQALAKANEWLSHRFMSFLTLCPACFLAAAAVTLSRQGVTTIPEELSRTMRSARRQSLSQHQQRPLYLAAEATLCLMEGQGRGRGPGQRQQALSLFAKASRGAAQEGYLFQLLAVLRIAVRVFPKFHPAHDYYREWLSQLQQILMAQPPVKLRDIEQAIFPPMPGVGQPAAPLPQ